MAGKFERSGLTMGSTIAVIPARGGSKGIPGKNLAKIGGVPLVVRAILAARAATRIDHVIVSSDDLEILNCAIKYGARAIERPPEIAGDEASSESALLDVLDRPDIAALDPDRIVMIQCTSPFTRAEELDSLIAALDGKNVFSAFTVAEDHGFLWSRNDAGTGVGVNHDHREPRQRRQDLSPQFRETGAAYAMDVLAFRESGSRFCGEPALIVTEMVCPEIDTPGDLGVARAIASQIELHRPVADVTNIAALVTDFDGVHTDDRVIVDQDGRESVRCSRADGMGIERLRRTGMPILILSKEVNAVVARRAKKLKISVIHGENDKLSAMRNWADGKGLALDQICFVGNDVNDVACMQAVGLSAAPSDARQDAIKAADIVLESAGGEGAVREICEILLLKPEDRKEIGSGL